MTSGHPIPTSHGRHNMTIDQRKDCDQHKANDKHKVNDNDSDSDKDNDHEKDKCSFCARWLSLLLPLDQVCLPWSMRWSNFLPTLKLDFYFFPPVFRNPAVILPTLGYSPASPCSKKHNFLQLRVEFWWLQTPWAATEAWRGATFYLKTVIKVKSKCYILLGDFSNRPQDCIQNYNIWFSSCSRFPDLNRIMKVLKNTKTISWTSLSSHSLLPCSPPHLCHPSTPPSPALLALLLSCYCFFHAHLQCY